MYLRLLTFLLLYSGTGAIAQMVPVTRFTSREAPYAERVTCMTQDSKGYMWFGTYYGLMRYDGYEWKKIGVPEEMRNKFVSTIESSGDTIYAGFSFGGGFLELQNGSSRKISLPAPYTLVTQSTRKENGKITISIFSETYPDRMAVYNYYQGKFEHLWSVPAQYENINDIKWDKNNNLWIATKKALIVLRPNGRIEEKITGIDAISILVNENKTVMVGAARNDKPLMIFINEQGKCREFYNDVGWLRINGKNYSGMWGFSDTKGLIKYDSANAETNYRFDIVPRTVVGSVFIDRENNLWLSSEAGLYRFSHLHAKSFRFKERGPSTGFIYTIPGGYLFTNGIGLYHFNGSTLSNISTFKKSGNLGFGYTDQENYTWMIQWGHIKGGIWKTRWNQGELKSSSFLSNYNGQRFEPSHVFQNSDKEFLVTGNNGIFVINDGKIVQFWPLIIDGKPIQTIVLCADQTKKNLYVGTNGKGIVRIHYSRQPNGQYKFQLNGSFSSSNGLKDDFIRSSLFVDKNGRIWAGSRNAGICCITEKGSGYEVSYIGQKEGLGCVRVNHMTERNGDIWAATCDGIYQIRDFKIARKYYSGDGLIGNDVHHFILNDNKLLIVTSEGMTSLELPGPNPTIPSITISDIFVDGKSNFSSHLKPLELQAGRNSIGFEYSANSFIDEKNVRYRYMLEGYDREWSEPVINNRINFASLDAGTYTFKVIAQNAQGVWSPTPATFRFTIVLPFYRSPWFYAATLAIACMVILFVVWYRRENQRKVEKIRMNIARDLHDDIGSALGSINILSRTAQRKLGNDKDAEAVVHKIGITAQKTLESMDEIIWTINPDKEKVLDLIVRMQNFAQPMLEGAGIEFHFSTNISDSQKLDMEWKRNIYLVFKELVYNAIKHAGCSNVFVSFNRIEHRLELKVEDDGVGFQIPISSERNGFNNVKSRAIAMNGDFRIEQRMPQGTIAFLSIPTE